MQKIATIAVAIALAGCAATPAGTPAAVDARAKAQAQFDLACKYASGGWTMVKPLTQNAALMGRLGSDLRLAIQEFGTAVEVTCNQPLDVANGAAVTQRVYDLAGQVMAEVLAAQARP